MQRYEIRLAGLGGQGIVLAGVILGRAAAIYDGKNATQAQSYGPEARGGACKSEVVISETEIDYPKVENPDMIGVMCQEAYDKYVDDIKPGGIVIYDPDMVPKTKPMKGIKVYTVPTMRIAEQTGRKIVANMVMVGAATAATGIVSQQAVEKTIEKLVPRGTEKLNISAFKAGYDHIKKIMVDDNVTGH